MAKVAFFCQELTRNNGWGVVAVETVKLAIDRGDEVYVFTASNATEVNVNLADDVVVLPLLHLHRGSNTFKFLLFFLLDWISLTKYLFTRFDSVHILIEPYWPLALLVRSKNRIGLIVGTHGVLPFRSAFKSFFYKRAIKKIESFHAISSYSSKRFVEASLHTGDIVVTRLGVDEFWLESTDCGFKERRLAFCSVGHLKQRKGILYALKAFKKIVDLHPTCKYHIVGSTGKEEYGYGLDSYFEECKKFVEINGLGNNVVFEGLIEKDEIKRIYSSSLAHLIPSINEGDYFEGFGLVHLEANACGTPSVGSSNCGNEDCIRDGLSGYLCEQKNVDSIFAAMERILKAYENGDHIELSRSSLTHARKYTWGKYRSLVAKLYDGQV